jgi:hypothetical protein
MEVYGVYPFALEWVPVAGACECDNEQFGFMASFLI